MAEMPVIPGLESMFYTLDGRFQGAVDDVDQWWDKLATTVPSTSRANHYYWGELLGPMRKWIGERVINETKMRSYTLENEKFEKTLGINVDDIDDRQFQSSIMEAEQIGNAAANWRNDVVYAALRGGESALAWDGQFFFDTDHPVNFDGGLGVYSNLQTGTPLTGDNFAQEVSNFSNVKGPDGRFLSLRPDLLIVSGMKETEAKRILESELVARTVGSTVIADTNINKGRTKLLVIPQMNEAPDDWYLADTTKPLKPMIFQQRMAPDFVVLDALDSPERFSHDRILMGSKARGAAGFTLPFLIRKVKAA